ncbi:MAG: type II secretion system F family protein [Rhodobacteraceae bacterium]|nr:type II secretion system F family protein [Paracoccaceae bacterium]
MAEFQYRGIESGGKTVSGTLQAGSEKSAYLALQSAGITPLSLAEASINSTNLAWWQRDISLFTSKISPSNLAISAKAIAILLNAGLPLNDALTAAIDSSPKPIKPILASVIRQVSQGEKLADAFAQHRDKLPDTLLMLIEVGEVANKLPETFLRAAEHFERQAETKRKLIAALVYPAILVLFSVFLLAVLVFFLVPALEPIFNSSGLALPTMLAILVRSKQFLIDNGVIILSMLVATPLAITVLKQTENGKRLLQSLTLRLPYLGQRLVLGDLSRFTHALSIMLKSGLSFQKSMQAASKTFNLLVLNDLASTALNDMKQGGSLTEHFTGSALIGKDIKQLILLADKSNQWQKIMGETAKALDAQIEQADRRLTNLITPIITIFIGSTIGILVVSVVSAILEINELAFQ